ncbi:DHA1 family chloramphenicol resistance protein-like MFS transporter [Crossiella equi]|uniref:DHA1 family chloramphenicol resistance protein-like MFS transporter n=3 Tax=Crossiella equi TaxID=130796 RepID=A0ABS5A4Z6_9PSEU|nr:DHA1 family chloramphenicol resistance protein-like MFS transporter [Crossiella equi]
MLSGLVPGIAVELGVSVPAAGALTSAYAVGMVVGAPVVALVSLRWPRRVALSAFLAVFLLVHVVGALTGSYGVLFGTRVVAALANAGFLAVALATATALVAPDRKGRATAVLLGGVTLACVAGVPAGALLGQLWGWRAAFWAVALASVPALLAVLRAVPAGGGGVVPSVRGELAALGRPQLVVVLVLGALVNGATFCSFTYLAPVATEVAGLGAGWVPVVLALFGLGSFLGVGLAGRVADSRPLPVLTVGGLVLAGGWAVFAVTAGYAWVALGLVLVLGTLSFGVGSTLISQALYAGSGAPRLAGASATAAFNVGAALGPWVGGLALAAGFGYRAPLWVSAGLVLVALGVGLGARRVVAG